MWASTLGCPSPRLPLSVSATAPSSERMCERAFRHSPSVRHSLLNVQKLLRVRQLQETASFDWPFCLRARALPFARRDVQWYRAQKFHATPCLVTTRVPRRLLEQSCPGSPASGAGQSPTWLSTRYRGAIVATANRSRRLGGYNRNIPYPSAARPTDLCPRYDASAGPYLSRASRIAIPPARWSWPPCGCVVAWRPGTPPRDTCA